MDAVVNFLACRFTVSMLYIYQKTQKYSCAIDDLYGDYIAFFTSSHGQVRAATLSGDCDLVQELMRGNFRLKGQFQNCVKRRAELSVKMNPCCSDVAAKAAVEKVFDRCFRDTAPFDRLP